MCFQAFANYSCGHSRVAEQECPLAADHLFYIKVACPNYSTQSFTFENECGLGKWYCRHTPEGVPLEKAYQQLQAAYKLRKNLQIQHQTLQHEFGRWLQLRQGEVDRQRSSVTPLTQEELRAYPDFHIFVQHRADLLRKKLRLDSSARAIQGTIRSLRDQVSRRQQIPDLDTVSPAPLQLPLTQPRIPIERQGDPDLKLFRTDAYTFEPTRLYTSRERVDARDSGISAQDPTMVLSRMPRSHADTPHELRGHDTVVEDRLVAMPPPPPKDDTKTPRTKPKKPSDLSYLVSCPVPKQDAAGVRRSRRSRAQVNYAESEPSALASDNSSSSKALYTTTPIKGENDDSESNGSISNSGPSSRGKARLKGKSSGYTPHSSSKDLIGEWRRRVGLLGPGNSAMPTVQENSPSKQPRDKTQEPKMEQVAASYQKERQSQYVISPSVMPTGLVDTKQKRRQQGVGSYTRQNTASNLAGFHDSKSAVANDPFVDRSMGSEHSFSGKKPLISSYEGYAAGNTSEPWEQHDMTCQPSIMLGGWDPFSRIHSSNSLTQMHSTGSATPSFSQFHYPLQATSHVHQDNYAYHPGNDSGKLQYNHKDVSLHPEHYAHSSHVYNSSPELVPRPLATSPGVLSTPPQKRRQSDLVEESSSKRARQSLPQNSQGPTNYLGAYRYPSTHYNQQTRRFSVPRSLTSVSGLERNLPAPSEPGIGIDGFLIGSEIASTTHSSERRPDYRNFQPTVSSYPTFQMADQAPYEPHAFSYRFMEVNQQKPDDIVDYANNANYTVQPQSPSYSQAGHSYSTDAPSTPRVSGSLLDQSESAGILSPNPDTSLHNETTSTERDNRSDFNVSRPAITPENSDAHEQGVSPAADGLVQHDQQYDDLSNRAPEGEQLDPTEFDFSQFLEHE